MSRVHTQLWTASRLKRVHAQALGIIMYVLRELLLLRLKAGEMEKESIWRL